MVAQWLALLPHSKKVLGSIPGRPRPFCVEFACSPRACVGFLRVLRFLPTTKPCMQLGLQLKISPLANTGAFTEMLINVHCPNINKYIFFFFSSPPCYTAFRDQLLVF